MKKTALVASIFLGILQVSAQRTPYDKGTMLFQAGLGVYSTVYSSAHSPSYNLSVERGIGNIGPGEVGIGIAGNFQTSSFNYNTGGNSIDYIQYDMKSYTFDIKGTYHPSIFPSKIIDVYGGFLFGSTIVNKNITPFGNPGSNNFNLGPKSDLHIGLLAGFRAYLFPKIGVFGEFGYDVSPIKFGFVAKF